MQWDRRPAVDKASHKKDATSPAFVQGCDGLGEMGRRLCVCSGWVDGVLVRGERYSVLSRVVLVVDGKVRRGVGDERHIQPYTARATTNVRGPGSECGAA